MTKDELMSIKEENNNIKRIEHVSDATTIPHRKTPL